MGRGGKHAATPYVAAFDCRRRIASHATPSVGIGTAFHCLRRERRYGYGAGPRALHDSRASQKWKVFDTVALLFVCDKYYPIID